MDVSIIIVNYNTKDLTMQCIDSVIEKTTDVKYEIILVDNASADGSVAALKAKYNDIIVIESPTNLGFGRANNLGVKSASGKYLFFLNSDTILLNNAISEFLHYCKENNNIGCVGAWLKDEDHEYTHSYGYFPTFTNVLLPFAAKKEICKANYYSTKVEYLTGAAMFVPSEVFLEIGGFHSSFFMYYEETFMQYNIKKMGLERVVINTPEILHLEGKSYMKKKSNLKRMDVTNSLLTYMSLVCNSTQYKAFLILFKIIKLRAMLNCYFTFKENKSYYYGILKK